MPSISWYCIAFDGKRVAHGENFVPGPDNCTACKCEKGKPQFCRAALCQPPQDCRSFRVGDSCCHFICLDDILPTLHNDINLLPSHDTGLRMVASSIVAILSLALLLFLIHRLRKRKLRNFATQQHFLEETDESVPPYTGDTRSNNPWSHSTAMYLSSNDHVDFFLNGCPPPYQPWKPPPYYLQSSSDAPPPYSEVMANDPPRIDASRLPSLNPLMVEIISRQTIRESTEQSLHLQNRQAEGSSQGNGQNLDGHDDTLPSQSGIRMGNSLPLSQTIENRLSSVQSDMNISPDSTNESLPQSLVVTSSSSDAGNHSASSRDISQSESVSSSNNSVMTSTQSSSHRTSEDHSMCISSPEPGGENDFSAENSGQTSDHRSPSRTSEGTASTQDSEHIISESTC